MSIDSCTYAVHRAPASERPISRDVGLVMRVAVELSQLHSRAAHRGLGRYAGAVVSAAPLLDDVTFSTFSVPLHDGRFGELWSVPGRLKRLRATQPDLQHTLSPYLLGRVGSRPWAVTILDLIPLLVSCHQRTGLKARAVHRWAARADVVLTLSAFSKSQIVAHLGVSPERVVVAPLPPALSSSQGDVGHLDGAWTDAPYALAIADCATPDPRKRLGWLEAAGAALADVGGRLVVVGAASDVRFGGARGVEPAGPVNDAELRALMVHARLFAFPSAYEGQGLPPLEAMSCGTPVVAMRNSSLPAVIGGGGVLVDEETSDWAHNACRASEQLAARARFAEACAELFGDDRKLATFGAEAVRHAETFSEREFAAGLHVAYELALHGS